MRFALKAVVPLVLALISLDAQPLEAKNQVIGVAEVDAMLAKENYAEAAKALLKLEAEHPRDPGVQDRMKRFTMIVQLRRELDQPVSVFVPGYAQKSLREYEALRKYLAPTDKEILTAFLGAAALVLSAEFVASWVENQTAQAEEPNHQDRSPETRACIRETREGSYEGAWIVECENGQWRGFRQNDRGRWESTGGLGFVPTTHSWRTLQEAAKVFCGCK